MESKLATDAKYRLLMANQRLTPGQRLEAFLVHNRLVMDLYRAGQRARAAARQPPS
jgi:hypothetical protein